MRFTYFHDEMYPSKGTDTQQVMKNLEGLTRAGGDVTLSLPRFPADWLENRATYARRLFEFYGVRTPYPITSVPCPIPYSRIRAEKLFHGIIGTLFSLPGRPDVFYSRNVPPVLTALQLGKVALYETYKPLPKAIPALFATLKPWLHNPRFLGIITHSNFARDCFIEHGVPEDKVVALHNGYDPEDLEPRLTTDEARRQLGLPEGVPLVGYAGNMQSSKNVPLLIEVVAGIPEAHLLLVGGRPDQLEELRAQARKLAPGRVHVAGWVEGYRVPTYLYACDVLAIPPSGRAFVQGHDTVLPMKLFQYLAVGRPLYVPDLPDTAELIIHDRHGFRTPPDEPARNRRDLAALLTDKPLAARLADGCLESAAELTWENRGRRIIEFVRRGLPQ